MEEAARRIGSDSSALKLDIESVLRKLGCRSIADAWDMAIREGLL
jgi:hypothetical protein